MFIYPLKVVFLGVFFFSVLQIFHLNRVRDLSQKCWFRLFVVVTFIDVVSTLYGIYGMDMPWSEEVNVVIHIFGPMIGFISAFICWNIVVLAIYYLTGMACRSATSRLGFSMFLWGTIFFRALAAFANMFQPKTGIDLSFLFGVF